MMRTNDALLPQYNNFRARNHQDLSDLTLGEAIRTYLLILVSVGFFAVIQTLHIFPSLYYRP